MGLPSMVAIMPRISSSTIAELSGLAKILSALSTTTQAATNTAPNSIKNPVGEYLQMEQIANLTRSKPSSEPTVPGTTGANPTSAPVATKTTNARATLAAGGKAPVRAMEVEEP
jgi:hypothetical protein